MVFVWVLVDLAKYATKSTEATGHTSSRLTADDADDAADDVDDARRNDHVGRLIRASWDTAQILRPAAGDKGSFAHSLNDAAVGVGASYLSDDSPRSPVFWDRQGQAHALPALTGPAEAWVNNDAGAIAGTGSTSSDPSAPNHSHALLWDAQHRVHDLGELPNTNDTKAFGISKNSWVVGYSALNDANGQPQTSHAWVWPHEGPLVPLPTPTNQMSSAHDVIENGSILGQVGIDLDQHGHAAVWTCRASH